jgi:Methyltransferase domain
LGIDSREIHSPSGRRELELNARNYRVRAQDRLGDGSLKQKFRDNIAAIRLVRQLHQQDRDATNYEKRVLVKYVGWGGIPQVFAEPVPAEWRSEGEELRALLTPDEYSAARASTLNAHYTSQAVVSAVYDALQHIGFSGGSVLEPAVGIGHFFGLMPEEMSVRSTLTGVEVDPLTAAIARQLYPDADIRAQGFETASLPDGSFDLAISNVPFGDYKLHDLQFNDQNFVIHDYSLPD